jgi:uncharacterized alpha-E superfamily protein
MMIMLSRVAERLYWMARYLERAEQTARLTLAYNHLIMDIPRGSEPGWDVLVRILDADPDFYSKYRVGIDLNVLNYLIADGSSFNSIPYAIKSVRENVRTTRDVLPEETWEQVNELHIYTQDMAEGSVGRRNRHAFLEEIINRCQMINGTLLSTLSRDHSYRFIKVGQLLERADMATRVIDVGAGDILDREGAFAAIDPLLWGALLQALSALSAYRRKIGPLVEKDAVVDFIFSESTFPRSVQFCLRGIREELGPLKRNHAAMRIRERARRKLGRFSAESASREELHRFIDDFQEQIHQLHMAISATWFQPDSR